MGGGVHQLGLGKTELKAVVRRSSAVQRCNGDVDDWGAGSVKRL
jgi:hypothetical protein